MMLRRWIDDGDAVYVAENMRRQDREEVALVGQTPAEAVWTCHSDSSDSFSLLSADEIPLAIAGVAELHMAGGRRGGLIWMLGTWNLELELEHPGGARDFLEASRLVVDHFRGNFDALLNWSCARNRAATKWLEWLGFTVAEPEPFGPSCALFRKFFWEKEEG